MTIKSTIRTFFACCRRFEMLNKWRFWPLGEADIGLYCHHLLPRLHVSVYNAHRWDSLRLAPTLVGGYMRGGQERGILHSIRWSHLLSTAWDAEFSFMKSTHSITRTGWTQTFCLPTEVAEPVRQHSGEITAGRQVSSFYNKNSIQDECWVSDLQCYILRKRKMMPLIGCWAPKH